MAPDITPTTDAPMSESFDIVLSKQISPAELMAALSTIIPRERLEVEGDIEELTYEPSIFAARIEQTHDPLWPCVVSTIICPHDLGLGEYPDLRVAIELWHLLACNALCGTYPFIENIDPHAPYYSFALVDGCWYLASTAGTVLMGPYSDEKNTFPGDKPVHLIRQIELPANFATVFTRYAP